MSTDRRRAVKGDTLTLTASEDFMKIVSVEKSCFANDRVSGQHADVPARARKGLT